MSQRDILVLLKKEKRWMSNAEIATKLKQNKCTANTSLGKLYKFGFVAKDSKYIGRRVILYFKALEGK